MGRPCIKGKGRKPKRYCRIAVDYAHKLKVLQYLDAIDDTAAVIDFFYPSLSKDDRVKKQRQISKWRNQRSVIDWMCENGKGHHKNLRHIGMGAVLSREDEDAIVMWINSMRKDGCPVSAMMLHWKAKEVAMDSNVQPFSASHTWRKLFMARNKLSIRARTRQGQTTPEDAASAASKFQSDVRAAIVQHNIVNVLNADQTGRW